MKQKFYYGIWGLVCAALFGGSSAAYSASADFNINPDIVRVSYESNVRRQELSDFAFMMFERKNPETDYAIQLGYNVQMNPDLKVGVRGIYVSPGTYDALAMGIGAQGRFDFTREFGIAGHLYYAPGITSAMDATNYQEFAISVGYYIFAQAQLYIGYRNLKVTVDDNNRKIELDDDFHVGLRADF